MRCTYCGNENKWSAIVNVESENSPKYAKIGEKNTL